MRKRGVEAWFVLGVGIPGGDWEGDTNGAVVNCRASEVSGECARECAVRRQANMSLVAMLLYPFFDNDTSPK